MVMQRKIMIMVSLICTVLIAIISSIDANTGSDSMTSTIIVEVTTSTVQVSDNSIQEEEEIVHNPISKSIKYQAIPDIKKEFTVENTYTSIPKSIEEEPDTEVIVDELEPYRFIQFIDNADTDITDEQLLYIKEKATDIGIDPLFILCTFYNESRGLTTVNNDSTNCRGYGGIAPDTGRYIYEEYLGHGKGTYDHQMAYDPYINIDISISTWNHLLEYWDGNIYSAMRNYSGMKSYEDWYFNKISNKLAEVGGPTLDEIQASWNKRHEELEYQKLMLEQEQHHE